MLSAALIAVIALLAYNVVRSVQTYYALRDFGGHWSAGWTRIHWFMVQRSGRMNLKFTDINRKYGKSL
jgi:hypothetical protein